MAESLQCETCGWSAEDQLAVTVEELAGLGRGGVAVLRAHFDKMLATIDALTTENATLKAEIEGYRQALEAVGSRARAAMEGQRG